MKHVFRLEDEKIQIRHWLPKCKINELVSGIPIFIGV